MHCCSLPTKILNLINSHLRRSFSERAELLTFKKIDTKRSKGLINIVSVH